MSFMLLLFHSGCVDYIGSSHQVRIKNWNLRYWDTTNSCLFINYLVVAYHYFPGILPLAENWQVFFRLPSPAWLLREYAPLVISCTRKCQQHRISIAFLVEIV